MLILFFPAFAAPWNVLQTEQVHVRCRGEKHQECEATALLSASGAAVRASIEDLSNYAERFASMENAHLDARGLIHIDFDLPFLLGDWRSVSRSRSWEDIDGWHLELTVTESRGRTPLFDTLTFTLAERPEASLLTIGWTHSLSWPSPIRDRITKQQGHNLVWGIALGADATPVSPIAGSSPPR